jgi:uncharacterized protein (TIGR02996 family)
MSTHEGLLSAIRDEPDSDEPRLILADWLDDHGEPERAEFIRVQCALARLPEYHDFRPDLEARERGLLLLHKDEWGGCVNDDQSGYRRGILERVEMGARSLLGDPDQYLGTGHIRELAITVGRPTDIEELARLPHLRFLHRLELTFLHVTEESLALLLSSPYLQQLVSLKLSCRRFSYATWNRILVDLPGLRELDLHSCDLSPDELRAVLPRRPVPLERLCLDLNKVGEDGIAALAGCAHLADLRELSLHAVGLTNTGLASLAQAPFAARLEKLDLCDNMGISVPPSLLTHSFPSLRFLNVMSCRLAWEASPPAAPAGVSALRELWVGNTHASIAGLAAWLRQPALAGLERLSVSTPSPYPLDNLPALIETVSAASSLARVRRLDLTATLTVEELADLLSGPHVRNWQSLGLECCQLDDSGAALLANCEALSGLRELSLQVNDLREAAARSLARSAYLKRLTSLILSSNRISDATPFIGTYLANPAILTLRAVAGKDELARTGIEAMRRVNIAPILARLATEGCL